MSLAEIDFAAKIWTLPASRAKNNRQHSIPLSDAALAILESLPRNGGAAIFEPQSFSKAKKQLDELLPLDMPGWVLHDLRRTAATNLARLGTALPVVEPILNHIGGSFAGVAGIYMKFEFSDEKREALAKLGEYCERLTVSPHQPAVTVDRNFRGASTVRRISKLLPVPRIVTLP
jgi:integrase